MKKRTIAIIAFILGAIMFSGVSSVVAYSFASNQVGFTPNDGAWQVNSVGDAINDLYIKKTGDNYSTEERVVGTWIDGRPIYQRFFNVSFDVTGNWGWVSTGIDAAANSIDNVISFTGEAYNDGHGVFYPTYVKIESGYVKVFSISGIHISGVILQYTKSTDTVQNNQG